MEKRIYFEDLAIRKEFFEAVKDAISANSWFEVAKHFGLARTHFQKYQYGNFTIPQSYFEDFVKVLPIKKQEYFLQKISKKPSNWGAIKGGKALFEKYPEEFERRRKNGLKKFLAIKEKQPYYNFDLTLPLTEDLCEFLGAFIGDGFTNKYGRHHEISFAGHSILDKNYLLENILPIANRLFGGLPGRKYFSKDKNGMYLKFHSKNLFKLLTERFLFPAGVKCYTVKIPQEIMDSNEKFIFATIRGIFDTDGCVFLDKRKKYAKYYPRITIQIASKNLHSQLKDFLSKHFSLYTYQAKRKRDKVNTSEIYALEIYGHAQVEKWMELIGFSNERHLSKIRLLH